MSSEHLILLVSYCRGRASCSVIDRALVHASIIFDINTVTVYFAMFFVYYVIFFRPQSALQFDSNRLIDMYRNWY